ncbi:unnamed protein product [Pleuronectes platessa]|uniref:Uncharacterized protein n=1 Tax=Pleuronectes platessa TaxID=8262 RepID=A0A9N7Z143_PLEPL|nr:unnamed protein product [Pleuronectes platessa]
MNEEEEEEDEEEEEEDGSQSSREAGKDSCERGRSLRRENAGTEKTGSDRVLTLVNKGRFVTGESRPHYVTAPDLDEWQRASSLLMQRRHWACLQSVGILSVHVLRFFVVNLFSS